MKLSEYIKSYRTSHGMSLRPFAERCGFSHQYLAKLEKDEVETPSFATIKKLASAMGMSAHELLQQVDDVTLQIYADDYAEDNIRRMFDNLKYDTQQNDFISMYNRLNAYNKEMLKMMAETMLKKQET